MRVLIAGGSGFLGRALSARLRAEGAHVAWLSRDPGRRAPDAIAVHGYDSLAPDDRYDAVVNLAGAGIADRRWSDRRKRELFDSRLGPTRALLEWMRRCERPPKVLLSGSAVGWYGARGDVALSEESGFHEAGSHEAGSHEAGSHEDFPHALCAAWEKAAMEAVGHGVPVALLRTGVVLDPAGGMLKRLLPPFRLGLGGRLGDGRQVLSWITREDWVEAVRMLVYGHLDDAEGAVVGPVNLTAPEPASNAEFTAALAGVLGRPALFPVPAALLKLGFGEMSTLLLEGQRVLPGQLQRIGFGFRHPRLREALQVQLHQVFASQVS